MPIICTLLTGDWPDKTKLGEKYVRIAYDSVKKFAPGIDFVCLSDREIEGVPTLFVRKMPGYCFEKLQLFRHGIFPAGTRVLFMDLDTAIVGPLDPLLTVSADVPVFLNDKGPDRTWKDRLGGGLFTFITGPEYYSVWDKFGWQVATDEEWFALNFGNRWNSWDGLLPGKIMSYKWDVIRHKRPIDDARVIFFHCQPRPHTVQLPWNPYRPFK